MNDDSGGKISSTGAAGYERESNYYYSPVGIETLTMLENEWYFGVVLEYDHFWRGKQISHLSDAVSGLGTLNNDQKKGYGFRGSLKFKKEGTTSYTIEPFIRYWNIEKSEDDTVTLSGSVIGVGWEPRNHSTEIGVRLSVRY